MAEPDFAVDDSDRLYRLHVVLGWLGPALARYGYWLEPGVKRAANGYYFTFAPIGQTSPSGFFGIEEAALALFDSAAVEAQLGHGAWPSDLIAIAPHGYIVNANGNVARWQPLSTDR